MGTDNSGELSIDEFKEVVKCYGVMLSDNRTLALFAKADKDASGLMDEDEFVEAVWELKKNIVFVLMQKMGLTMSNLLRVFLAVMLSLLVMVTFILTGIAAFTNGTSFGAVINSAGVTGFGYYNTLTRSDADDSPSDGSFSWSKDKQVRRQQVEGSWTRSSLPQSLW